MPSNASNGRGRTGAQGVSNGLEEAGGDGRCLRCRGIVKTFGPLTANDNVSLSIGEGEIHALLGENGAGKSTLVKMLYGSLQPDAAKSCGTGNPVTIASPLCRAQNRHRHGLPALLAVRFAFGRRQHHRSPWTANSVAATWRERARRVSADYGLPLNPASIVGDLSVGERQRVEIVRCLLQDPSLIILDEPTSVLTPQEADNLFVTLERLKREGRSILYISHRLDEVKRLCDRATMLRHGKVVGECDPRQETASSLATMMVGNECRRGEARQR